MEKDFNKKSLKDKLSHVRSQIEASDKERIISEGAKKYNVLDENYANSRVSVIKNVKSPDVIELKKVTEKENKNPLTGIEKHILSIGEYKLKDLSSEALYIMKQNLNASTLDSKIIEAETYIDSIFDSEEKSKMYRNLEDIKREIDNYKTFGTFDKGRLERLNVENEKKADELENFIEDESESNDDENLENNPSFKEREPLSPQEFKERAEAVDSKEIDTLEESTILGDSNPTKKEKVKRLFNGITKVVNTVAVKAGKVAHAARKFDQKMYNTEQDFFDNLRQDTEKEKTSQENEEKQEGKRVKEEIKKRAQNINKIRRERKEKEAKAKKEEEKKIKAEKDAERKEEERIKKEEKDKEEAHKREIKKRAENINKIRKEKEKKEAESFLGREYFPEDFEGKGKRDKKVTKERKKLNTRYEDEVKKLNDKYFANLLGEENLKELRNIEDRSERKQREREMIEDIASKVKRPLDREEIFEKLKIRDSVENEIDKRREKIKEATKAEAMRRRFSIYIEKDLAHYKNKIEELKKRELPGDKEQIKRIQSKIKSLNKISRVKVNLEKDKSEKVETEKIKERKEKIENPVSKEKFEKTKKELLQNLKGRGLGTITSTFNATLGALYKGTKSGIASRSFGEGLGVMAVESGKGTIEAIKNLLKLLFGFGIDTTKLAYRYVKK